MYNKAAVQRTLKWGICYICIIPLNETTSNYPMIFEQSINI
jgi:hypothetical protein